jgi:hypothetical protein
MAVTRRTPVFDSLGGQFWTLIQKLFGLNAGVWQFGLFQPGLKAE